MAVKYLAGDRLIGTAAERAALTKAYTTISGIEMVGVEWDTDNLNNMEVTTTPEWTSADGISNASPLVGSILKKDAGTSNWADAWDADARSVQTYLGGSGTVLITVVNGYVNSGAGNTATYAACFKEHDGNFAAASEVRSDILGWYANGGCAVFHYGTQESNLTTYANSPLTKLKTVLETNGTTTFWYAHGSGIDATYTLAYTDTTNRTGEEYKVWGIIARENSESISIITGEGLDLNLPNGAIFEESDTGKHYMFDGTSAWNEM